MSAWLVHLPSWLPRGPTRLTLILLLLAGCAQIKTGPERPAKGQIDDSYARTDLDELLNFGVYLGSKNTSKRAEVCRALLDRQKTAPGTGIQLHLLVGRLLSDACGDVSKILVGVAAIPADDLPDERVRHLVAAQKEALKRMLGLSKKLAVLERKQKSLQSLLASKESKNPGNKPKSVKAPRDGEAHLLRDKLEAIRAMEQKLDETGDGS